MNESIIKNTIFFLFFINVNCYVLSQTDKVKTLETEVELDTTKHSVKKASILSAIVPGAGQFYNHFAKPKGKRYAFLKVPLIYAGLGATGYFMLKNNRLRKELKNEYLNREKGKPTLEKYAEYDSQSILSLFEQHARRRDLFIIGFAAVYVLQIVDAAVEAQFVEFDISDDLTFKISPQLHSFNNFGIKLSLNIQ